MRGAYTPQVQEAITRLGSRLTYKEAQEELKMLWGVDISVGSVRVITMRNGQIANELLEEEQKRLEREAPKAEATPKQIVGQCRWRNGAGEKRGMAGSEDSGDRGI